MKRFARAIALSAALLVPALSRAADAPAPEETAPAISATTSGALAAAETTPPMKPGVPKAPVDRYGFFFAAYGVVWVVLLLYVGWLSSRVRALEAAGKGATGGSR